MLEIFKSIGDFGSGVLVINYDIIVSICNIGKLFENNIKLIMYIFKKFNGSIVFWYNDEFFCFFLCVWLWVYFLIIVLSLVIMFLSLLEIFLLFKLDEEGGWFCLLVIVLVNVCFIILERCFVLWWILCLNFDIIIFERLGIFIVVLLGVSNKLLIIN